MRHATKRARHNAVQRFSPLIDIQERKDPERSTATFNISIASQFTQHWVRIHHATAYSSLYSKPPWICPHHTGICGAASFGYATRRSRADMDLFGIVGSVWWHLGTQTRPVLVSWGLDRHCSRQYFTNDRLGCRGRSKLLWSTREHHYFLGMDHHDLHATACYSVWDPLEDAKRKWSMAAQTNICQQFSGSSGMLGHLWTLFCQSIRIRQPTSRVGRKGGRENSHLYFLQVCRVLWPSTIHACRAMDV